MSVDDLADLAESFLYAILLIVAAGTAVLGFFLILHVLES